MFEPENYFRQFVFLKSQGKTVETFMENITFLQAVWDVV